MEAKTISLKTISTALFAIVIIETGFRLAISGTIASSLPVLGIIRCLESISLVVIVLSIERQPNAIGLSRPNILTGFMRGLFWSACFGIAAGVGFLILKAVGINALNLFHRFRPSPWQHLFYLFLVGGVIGPIAEEILFRGIIYGYLRRWGASIAIILSTLIFVFTHPSGQNLPFTQLIGGILFAIAYEKEQNLMVPITIHCIGNLTIFSLAILL